MVLLLTSNGLKGKIADIFPTLLKKSAKENKVAFITTAAYGEEGDPSSWLEKYRQELREQGISSIRDVDLQHINQQDLAKILQESDIVYVNGGNTFFLLYYVRKSGSDKEIAKFLADGKLYIGVSAGSIICCPSIEIAGLYLSEEYPADKNDVGLTDLTGLNLVSLIISPHYEDNQKELIAQELKNAKFPVVTLTDTQGLLVQDGSTEVIGE